MDKSNNAALVDEFGLRDYLAERFADRGHALKNAGSDSKTSKTWASRDFASTTTCPTGQSS